MTFPICIGGEFCETAHTLDVTCSFDGSLVGTTYLAGQPQLEKAITMAEEVRTEMKEMPSWKKYDILMKSASALRLHKYEMANIIAGE
ncbi:MAG: aldehyde dehydrogenase family protein, partial [Bacteroidales bacterium]|nr:aldehyde dehydrogenase family protein [Bacteroidales bacterium]